ncbi:P-loop containing nucleoside triphosphate hydrolase protein [Mycena crocata]|nr:P-loop containing nucleoside triphosphate hydrolase protein [Mycena crocata]
MQRRGTGKKGGKGGARPVPMKVLVLGFPRTGTASMRAALEKLGYDKTHHMDSVIEDPTQVDAWMAAINAKFHKKGEPWGRNEWDALLGHYQALTDTPSMLFSLDLLAAYPDAKVILTMRDPDAWWRSYDDTIGTILRSRRTHVAEAMNPARFGKFMALTRECCHALLGSEYVSPADAKARFTAHYDKIRKAVPKDHLLEYRVGEGWERLCAFLGDEVPADAGAFPKTNDTKMILRRAASARMRVIFGWFAVVVLPAFAVMVALSAWFAQWRQALARAGR